MIRSEVITNLDLQNQSKERGDFGFLFLAERFDAHTRTIFVLEFGLLFLGRASGSLFRGGTSTRRAIIFLDYENFSGLFSELRLVLCSPKPTFLSLGDVAVPFH